MSNIYFILNGTAYIGTSTILLLLFVAIILWVYRITYYLYTGQVVPWIFFYYYYYYYYYFKWDAQHFIIVLNSCLNKYYYFKVFPSHKCIFFIIIDFVNRSEILQEKVEFRI